jgi:hypothetical protein
MLHGTMSRSLGRHVPKRNAQLIVCKFLGKREHAKTPASVDHIAAYAQGNTRERESYMLPPLSPTSQSKYG